MRTTKITIELVNLLQETLKHREIRIANLESTVTELSEMAVKLLNSIVDPDQAIDEETLKGIAYGLSSFRTNRFPITKASSSQQNKN